MVHSFGAWLVGTATLSPAQRGRDSFFFFVSSIAVAAVGSAPPMFFFFSSNRPENFQPGAKLLRKRPKRARGKVPVKARDLALPTEAN